MVIGTILVGHDISNHTSAIANLMQLNFPVLVCVNNVVVLKAMRHLGTTLQNKILDKSQKPKRRTMTYCLVHKGISTALVCFTEYSMLYVIGLVHPNVIILSFFLTWVP